MPPGVMYKRVMSRSFLRATIPVVVALSPSMGPSLAGADGLVCDSCASCTEKLAASKAHVVLANDVAQTGQGACVVVRGDGAQLDGFEHLIKASPGGTAVRVEAANVLVKNLHVTGGATGVEIASAARTTVFHVWIAGTEVGLSVQAGDAVRVTRSVIAATGVGISFRAQQDGTCAGGGSLKSPGAVVTDTRVQGAKVGIAACEAYPVLARDEVVDNGIGVLLGAPAAGGGGDPKLAGPFDPCVCAPQLDGMKPGTTLLYSSGCGGCQVHEAWLPELRKNKADILLRETGRGKSESMAKFDAFMDRCAPEVTDVVGVPGCVPNYTCLANGVTFKTRQGDKSMTFEAQLNSADDVAAYAKECEEEARRRFRAGKSCVAHALASNVVCHNRELDVRALPGGPRLDGIDDSCDKTEGFADSGAKACSKTCPASLPARSEPAARATRDVTGAASPAGGGGVAAAASAVAVPSSQAPGRPASGAAEEPAGGKAPSMGAGWKGWLVGVAGVGLAAAALRMLLRSSK